MKKILKLFWPILLLTILLCSNLVVFAAEEVVTTATIYHTHVGNTTSGGLCYKTVPHSHIGNTTSGGTCYKTPVYHQHTGDSVSGGGCYSTTKCGGTPITPYGSHYIHICTVCGYEWAQGQNNGCGYDVDATPGEECHNIKCPYRKLICGKTEGVTIDSYKLSCTKTSATIDGYTLNCGKTTSTVDGTLQLVKDKGSNYTLKIKSTGVTVNSYTWNTGASSQSIAVTTNQTYTCTVKYTVNGTSSTKTLTYIVSDYDTTPPEVNLEYNDTEWSKSKEIRINAIDTGVGLHSQAYRFYNGTEWSDWSHILVYNIEENGTYSVEVRDKAGNTSSKTFEITHIDNEKPIINVLYDNTIWELNKTITVIAADYESGLPNTSYRYSKETDKLTDWTSDSSYVITSNGTYNVEVRDNLENIETFTFEITYIDTEKPNVELNYNDSTWEKIKEIEIIAEDAKVGLHETPYRVFNGVEWTEWFSVNTFNITNNGVYTVEVRDKLKNIETFTFEITHIDKTPPEGNVSFNDTTWELEKIITVSAFDDGIGLTDNPYRYSKDGITWTEWTNDNTYKVTANGTYYVEIIDKLGLSTKNNFTITHIDTENPVVNLEYDNVTWEKEKTVTIVASDEKSGLHNLAYRFNNGTTWSAWTSSNAFNINKNGKYIVEVRDIIENTTQCEFEVTHIDEYNPTFNIQLDDITWELEKIITIKANDQGIGLDNNAYRYSKDGTIWTNWISDNTYKVTANGTYYVEVRDKLGLSTKDNFTVTHIDIEKPIVNLEYDNVTWEKEKNVTIIANDEKSGLHNLAYRFNDGNGWTEWSSKTNYTIIKNGTYEIEVRDRLENTTNKSFTIDYIDLVAPTVTVTFDDITWELEKTITVNASDNETGLTETPYRYSKDGTTWSEWTSNNQYLVLENGTYYVEAKDKADLVTQKIFTITHIDTEKPTFELQYNDTIWTNEIMISIAAEDSKSGLHEIAYRFYNGVEWTEWSNLSEYKVTKNGEYQIEVRDALENTENEVFNITHIDENAPIVELVYDNITWELEKTITVNASDNETGLAVAPYRYSKDGITWTEWTNDNTYKVTANGIYYVEVRDSVDLVNSLNYEISYIDTEKPTFSLNYNNSKWDKIKEIEILAEDAKVGLHGTPYRVFNGVEWTEWFSVNTFNITNNGVYTVEVRDKLENVETFTFEITHIDKTPPEASISFDDVTWELEKIITVSAHDDGIGLTNNPYRYSVDKINWTEWTNDNTYKVTANGTYYVEVIDKADLSAIISYEITHIDRESPNIELNYDTNWNANKTLVIKANDTKSGLHKFPYRFYDGTKWSEWSEITAYSITKNGTYSVEVRDMLENTYIDSLNITTIDDVAPIIENIEIPEDAAQSKIIKVTAKDEGVGLASSAYSYSIDGKTWSNWTSKNSYTVNQNCLLYIKIKDAIGNIAETSKEINNIDNDPPVIELVYDNEKPEQTKTILVKTNEKDLVYRICINEIWSEWSNKSEWNVDKNASYRVQAMDKAGNITSLIANITNIDSIKPIIKITFDEDGLSKNKIVRVEVEENNLPEYFIRVNGGEWTNITSFEFIQNGIYTIEVRDMAGNITSYTFEIKSIVNEGPEINLIYNNEIWEKTKVAYIELINPEFDVNSYQYSFYTKEGWQPYSKNNSVTLNENGVYAVKVRDELANITTFEYEITKIDNIEPNVDLIYDKELYSTEITIEINAEDKESGLAGKAYRYYVTEWSEWSSDNTFTLEQNGAFAVEVQDSVGNIASIKDTINIIDNEAPEVELYVDDKTNTIKVIAKDYGSGLANEAYKWNNEEWTNLAIREFENLDNIVIEVRDSVGNSIVLNSKSIKKGFTINQLNNENTNQVSKKFKEVASTAAGIIGCSALVIFLFLYFKPKPKVGVIRNNVFNEVCSADIKIKPYWVELNITQEIIDKAQSESLTILFNDSFIKKHKNKSLRVNLPEEEITMKLEKVVEL